MNETARSQRWMPLVGTFIAVAFGIWAGVVAWGVRTVIDEVRDIHEESVQFHREFNAFVLQSEKRLTTLEEEQRTQDMELDFLQRQHNAWTQEASKPRR